MSANREFLNTVTGVTDEYPESLADTFPYLIPVNAYVPIADGDINVVEIEIPQGDAPEDEPGDEPEEVAP